jgi:hypothetical protein
LKINIFEVFNNSNWQKIRVLPKINRDGEKND